MIALWLAAGIGQLTAPASISATRLANLDACNSTRVSLSPDGRWLAAWTKLGDQPLNQLSVHGGHAKLQIASTECVLQRGSLCGSIEIKSRNRFKSLAWTTDDSLVIMSGAQEIALADPEDGTLRYQTTISPSALTARFVLNGPFERNELSNWLERINSTLTDGTKAESAYNNDGVFSWTIIRMNTATNQFARIDRNTLLEFDSLPSPAHWREAPRLYRDGHVIASGTFITPPAATFSPDRLVNPQPIFDSESGSAIGAFDDRNVLWTNTSANLGLDSVGAKLDYISDVAIHQDSRTSAVIWRLVDGSHRITVTKAGLESTIECQNLARPLSGHLASPQTVKYLDWGVATRPLPVRLVKVARPAGLVVLWRGGPGGTFSRGHSYHDEQIWLKRGYDVALVEQTGSTSATSLMRFKSEGFDAFDKDGTDAAKAIGDFANHYKRLVIVGSSFGAIPAATMAAEIEAAGASSELVLIAPWFAYRDPSERLASDDFFRINPDFARVSDAGLFGPPFMTNKTGIGDRMLEWRSTFKFSGRTLAVFGGKDLISRPGDLWRDAAMNRAMQVRIVPNAGHGTVSEFAESEIVSWLQK